SGLGRCGAGGPDSPRRVSAGPHPAVATSRSYWAFRSWPNATRRLNMPRLWRACASVSSMPSAVATSARDVGFLPAIPSARVTTAATSGSSSSRNGSRSAVVAFGRLRAAAPALARLVLPRVVDDAFLAPRLPAPLVRPAALLFALRLPPPDLGEAPLAAARASSSSTACSSVTSSGARSFGRDALILPRLTYGP